MEIPVIFKFLPIHVEQLVEIDAPVGELAERSLLLELSEVGFVLHLNHDCDPLISRKSKVTLNIL